MVRLLLIWLPTGLAVQQLSVLLRANLRVSRRPTQRVTSIHVRSVLLLLPLLLGCFDVQAAAGG
jgi:hypothetical protein